MMAQRMKSVRAEQKSGPTINVISGADEAYALPLATMLHSLLSNVDRRASVQLCLIDGGVTTRTRRRLTDLVKRHHIPVSISWVPTDVSEFAHLPTLPYLSPVSFARLKLPGLLPDVDRAIYVDADLVVQGDVLELWQTDVEGAPIGAVQDFGVPTVSAPYGIRAYDDLELEPTREYFNTGVLLIDLTNWRKQHLSERAFQYLSEYSDELQIADQEALNVAVQDQWHRLDPTWNLTTEYFTNFKAGLSPTHDLGKRRNGRSVDGLPDSAEIVHYTSASKPWNADCDHPLRHLFHKYLHDSAWLSPAGRVRWQTRHWVGRVWHSVREHTRPFRRHIPLLTGTPES